ncbi:MAG: hypothetical protein Q9M28_05580 [Mariprofundaceae bacterium]|nr:hypothetical protein [Mariprofundaceae bacterium]
MKKTFLCLMSIWLLFNINAAWASDGTHVHIAVLFIDKGALNESFPAELVGDDIEGALKGKAELMTFAHSANILNGDVLNIQNDTLRFNDAKEMEDYGINCSLSMSVASGSWTTAGLCKVFLSGKDKQVTHIIPSVSFKKSLVWYKLFEDKANHIIAYSMKESGENL